MPSNQEQDGDNPSKQEQELDKENLFTRFFELIPYTSRLARAIADWFFKESVTDQNQVEVENELEAGVLIGNASGFIIAGILRYLTKKYYKGGKTVPNPFYRAFKTLSSAVGVPLGNILSYCLSSIPVLNSFPDMQKFISNVLVDIVTIAVGLLTIPYWIINQLFNKKAAKEQEKNPKPAIILARVGESDGWSKYAKAAFIYGTFWGQVILAVGVGIAREALTSAKLLVGGAIGGLASFILSVFLVPLVNKLTLKTVSDNTKPGKTVKLGFFMRQDKEDFRTNYVRSAANLGLALGGCIGAIIGTYLLPGPGTMVGLTLGSAIGGLIVGTLGGVYGSRVLKYIHRKFKMDRDTDNSIDFTTRSCSYLFGFLGSAVGIICALWCPLPGLSGLLLAAAGSAIGGAVGSLIGWGAGVAIPKIARTRQPKEVLVKKLDQPVLSWTQRVGYGSNAASVGLMLGFGLGFALIMAFGWPVTSAVIGAMICSNVCGFVGGVIGGFYKRKHITEAERMLKQQQQSPVSITTKNSAHSPTSSVISSSSFCLIQRDLHSPTPSTSPSPPPQQSPLQYGRSYESFLQQHSVFSNSSYSEAPVKFQHVPARRSSSPRPVL